MPNVRLVDVTNGLFIEVPDNKLLEHLYKVVDELKEERSRRIDLLATKVQDVDTAIKMFVVCLSDIPVGSEESYFKDMMDRIANISGKINKLQTFANGLALQMSATSGNIIRLSLDQAEEFCL